LKIAITADIHLSNFNQDPIDKESGLRERLSSLNNSLRYMFDYCISHEINKIIIAGDLFHNKGLIYTVSQNMFIKILNDYKDKVCVKLVTGNHDLSSKTEDGESSLLALSYHPNLTYFSSPYYDEKNSIFYAPYNSNMINSIKENSANILISHFGLNEGILNNGTSIIADISLRDLTNKYKVVILGHYHKPQEIINDNIKFYYTGSPIQLNWGESGEEKRFLILDTETLDVESILFEGYKKYIKLELNKDNYKDISKEIQKIKESGDYIKVIKKDDINLTEDLDVPIVDRSEKDITNRGINSSMDIESKLTKYLEIKNVQKEDFEYIKTIGMELVRGE
jgi:DNA repair exonuclease SbcCD nuclease subunit